MSESNRQDSWEQARDSVSRELAAAGIVNPRISDVIGYYAEHPHQVVAPGPGKIERLLDAIAELGYMKEGGPAS